MRRLLLLASLAAGIAAPLFSASTEPAVSASTPAAPVKTPPQIKIVYPREGAKMAPHKSSFVYGSVQPPQAGVRVNGVQAAVHKTGSYLVMIPFPPGDMKITARAESNGLTSEAVHTVSVSSPPAPLAAKGAQIAAASLEPSLPVTLSPGDTLPVRFRGTPACRAEFRLKRLTGERRQSGWEPLVEKTPASGLYAGDWIIPSGERAEEAVIEYRLENPAGQKAKAESKVKIVVQDPFEFRTAEVTAEEATLRTGPAPGKETMGYDLFLPRGTRLKITGQIGEELRAAVSRNQSGWLDAKNVKLLPGKSQNVQTVVDNLRFLPRPRGFLARTELREKVPYRATLANDLKTFTLTLYYALADLDRFAYEAESSEKWLEKARWSQEADQVVQIQFELKEKLWGYDLHYEGNALTAEFIFAPRFKKSQKVLEGIKVAVDPGHSPQAGQAGAASPQGVDEEKVNVQIAACLKERLEKLGARVFLTREKKEAPDLLARSRRAWEAGSDLFVSVHANALSDGQNPFERHGFSVYYFQPQSHVFGKLVHEAYKERLKIPDDGFYYGNLSVCRTTQMPAVLTESAYLIYPPEEELLLSREFQCLCADAMAEGVVRFVKSYR